MDASTSASAWAGTRTSTTSWVCRSRAVAGARTKRSGWSFHDATAEPHPSPQPELWVGGSSEPAIRRALELGDVWHPSRGSDPDHVRRVKELHPKLRVIPRTRAELVDAMLEAGAEGAVVQFSDEPAMRDFARRRLSA